MTRHSRFSCITLICLLAQNVSANAEQYICVADKSTGFIYNSKSKDWTPTIFSVKNHTYIIAPPTKEDLGYPTAKFVFKGIGEKFVRAVCKIGFEGNGILYCQGLGGTIIFNKGNGRYISDYLLGYYNTGANELGTNKLITDTTSDDPYMEIGKCSSFETKK